MKTKKNFIFILSVLFLFSCSENNILHENEDNQSNTVKTAGDGKYDVLGYGYDVTDDYLNENAIKRSVIDVNSFIKDKSYYFDNPFLGTSVQRIFAGGNAYTYLKDISKGSEHNNSLGLIDPKEPIFTGSITRNYVGKYSYSNKYSFARADIMRKHRRYVIYAEPTSMQDYLSPLFKEDLEKLSPDQIVLRYGTHVLLDFSVGGMYVFNYRSAIKEQSSTETKTSITKSGLNFGLSKLGFKLGNSSSTTTTIEESKMNSEAVFNLKIVGGQTSGHTMSFTPGSLPTNSINFGAWEQSIDDAHSRIVEINWNSTYPIYEFITDPQKKLAVKNAVNKYINSKKIEVLPIVPLYRFYMNKGNDHFYSTSRQEPVNYSHTYEGVAGYIFLYNYPGTIPLYRFYMQKMKEHFYSTVINEPWMKNFSNEGIVGYVYGHQAAGTTPLYRYYNNKLKDHFYTTNWNELGSGKGNYGFENIQCYIFP